MRNNNKREWKKNEKKVDAWLLKQQINDKKEEKRFFVY